MNAKKSAAGVAAVMVVAIVVVWLVAGRRANGADGIVASGTVEATEADLGFQYGGRIAEVRVREGDGVAAGDTLASLETNELMARLAATRAQHDAARALLVELERGARPEEVRQAEAAERAARERLEEAERLHARAVALEREGAVSRESLDQARTALEVARAQHASAREQLDLVQRGPRAERIEAQRAAVRQAEAAIAQAEASLTGAVIVAPFDGVVTVRHRQQGEAVGPGAPVLTVMDPSDRWVRIYVRQDLIGGVSIGQAAEILSDSDRTRTWPGGVTFIATQAEFTPRNVQTAEERVKLVYAVKVAVRDDPQLVLKPGVPADVRLVVQ